MRTGLGCKTADREARPVIGVVVVDAEGYRGGELIRLLLGHPLVNVVAAGSDRLAGRRVDGVHPNLRGWTELTFMATQDLPGADAVFMAGIGENAGVSIPGSAQCLLDLSLRSHRDPLTLAPQAMPDQPTPGWPEVYRTRLAGAGRITVPGCLAVATALALRPLASAGLVAGTVSGHARIASSVATTMISPDHDDLHAERSGSMRVLAPSLTGQELDDIEQVCGLAATMTVIGVDAVRGVQALCHVRLRTRVAEQDVRALFRDCYRDEPFVRVIAARHGPYRLPDPKILIGSNVCDVGFAVNDSGDAVTVVGALDNLGKGSAGNAVQCLNIRMGWPERLGLGFPGLHPI